MPSISQKAPIPLPVNGVLKGINPRLIGPAGLTESKNWIYRDGKFRVRDGMVPLGQGDYPLDGIYNLIAPLETMWVETDGDDYMDATALLTELGPFAGYYYEELEAMLPGGGGFSVYTYFYGRYDPTEDPAILTPCFSGFLINPSDALIPGVDPPYSGPTMNPDLPPELLGSYWWDSTSGGMLFDGALQSYSQATWTTGDPDFLGSVDGVDKYASFVPDPAIPLSMHLTTPVVEVPIQAAEYQFRIMAAVDSALVSTVKVVPWSVKYIGVDPTYDGTTGSVQNPAPPEDADVTPGDQYYCESIYGGDSQPGKYLWGYPVKHDAQEVSVAPGWTGGTDTELVTTVDLTGYGDHTHIWFQIIMEPTGGAGDYVFAFSEAQITYGEQEDFLLPSDGPASPGIGYVKTLERPMGLTQFDTTQDSGTTVMGTTGSWWLLNTDLTWTSLCDPTDDPLHLDYDADAEDGNPAPPLTAADNYAQVCFEVFDTSDPTEETGADKYLVGCNGIDPTKYWDGETDTYLTVKNTHVDSLVEGEPVEVIRAKTMAMTFDRFMYGNIRIGDTPALPDAVVYTYQLTFNKWKATNIVRLADTPGPITAMQEMGNQLTAIYKTDAIYVAQAQGGQLPFSFQLKAAHVTGPASPNSVVSIDEGLHVYLAEDGDLVLFDGVRPRSLTPTAHNLIQAHMNFEKIRQTFGMYNRALKELYFIYPPQGDSDNTAGVMISMADPNNPTIWPMNWQVPISAGGFTYIDQSVLINELEGRIEDLVGTIYSFGSYNPAILFCSPTDVDGNMDGMAYMSKGFVDSHGPVNAYFRTGLYDFGEIGRYKTIKEIDHLFSADEGQAVDISLITSDFGKLGGAVDSDTLDLDEGPFISSHRMTGRLFQLAIETDAAGRIEWLGSEAAVEPRGLR